MEATNPNLLGSPIRALGLEAGSTYLIHNQGSNSWLPAAPQALWTLAFMASRASGLGLWARLPVPRNCGHGDMREHGLQTLCVPQGPVKSTHRPRPRGRQNCSSSQEQEVCAGQTQDDFAPCPWTRLTLDTLTRELSLGAVHCPSLPTCPSSPSCGLRPACLHPISHPLFPCKPTMEQ